MKKLMMVIAASSSIAGFAALDTHAIRADVAFPNQVISSGSTVTNSEMSIRAFRGLGEINFAIGSVSDSASNRVVTATLIGTNTVSGGWSVLGTSTYKGQSAGVMRMPIVAHYLPPIIKVSVGVTEANSAIAGTMLSYK